MSRFFNPRDVYLFYFHLIFGGSHATEESCRSYQSCNINKNIILCHNCVIHIASIPQHCWDIEEIKKSPSKITSYKKYIWKELQFLLLKINYQQIRIKSSLENFVNLLSHIKIQVQKNIYIDILESLVIQYASWNCIIS